jgi:hypothetical protein
MANKLQRQTTTVKNKEKENTGDRHQKQTITLILVELGMDSLIAGRQLVAI